MRIRTLLFSLCEADGVRVALAWLRNQAPGQRIGVIGTFLARHLR